MREELRGKPAGFWRRVVAAIVDGLILFTPFWILIYILMQSDNSPIYDSKINSLLAVIIGICYSVYFLSSKWQATPGKRLLGIYVIGLGENKPISWNRAFARYAILNPYLILTLPMVFFSSPAADNSQVDTQKFNILQSKLNNKEPLNDEDKKFLDEVKVKAMHPGLSEEDAQKMLEIKNKKDTNQYLTPAEIEFSSKNSLWETRSFIVSIMESLYMLAMALTIGMTREKKGFHDMICKTRVIHGRPEKPMAA